jgi:prevent-host-death family protein
MKKITRTVNINEARRQLSKLIDQASKGEPFIIARAGKPLVKVAAIDASRPTPTRVRRLGFMTGQIAVPANFDTMGRSEIQRVFEGRDRDIRRS